MLTFSLAHGELFAHELHHSRRGAGPPEEAHSLCGRGVAPALSVAEGVDEGYLSVPCSPSRWSDAGHCAALRPPYPRASRMSSAVRDKLTITIGLYPGQQMQYTQQEGRETHLEALRLSSRQAVR